MFTVSNKSLILTKLNCEGKMRIDLIIIKNKQVPYLYSQWINFHEWFILAFAILMSGLCSQWAQRGTEWDVVITGDHIATSNHLSARISMRHTRPQAYWKVKPYMTTYHERQVLCYPFSQHQLIRHQNFHLFLYKSEFRVTKWFQISPGQRQHVLQSCTWNVARPS